MRPLLLAVLLVSGCGRSEPAPSGGRHPPVVVPSVDAAPVARDTVGVPVCDAYIEDFARCIRKLDRAAQPAARRALDSLRRSWMASSRFGDAGGSLGHACQMATEAARAATAGIGCSF